MNKQLPERALLDHLKGQAKKLLNSLRSNDPAALARVGTTQASYRLADAQRILAREYGFPSWTKLKQHVQEFPDRKAAFFHALKAGERDVVQILLDFDPSLIHSHFDGAFGAAPITVAAERDDIPLIELLLDRGADINARSTWWAGGFGALDTANEATSMYLISRGAKLSAHSAARLGLVDELKEILRLNPDVVRERGGDGQYPLHFSKTPEIVDLLVDAGSELDARDLDHVSTAAQFRILEIDVCRRLVERGATPDVYVATMLEDIPLLERLIDADPECLARCATEPGNPMIPNAPGMPIYTYTIGGGRLFQIAEKFGKSSALQVIERRSSPALKLMSACWRGDVLVAKELASHLTELTNKDFTILPEAAWERKLDAVQVMLNIGFPPDCVGVHLSSAIDRAAFHGFDDIIEAILPYGPSLAILNEFGGTPLRACLRGSRDSWRKDGDFVRSVELLLEAGSPRPEKGNGSPSVNAVLERYGIETG